MQLPNLVMLHFLLSNLHTHGHMIYDNLPVLINLKFNKCGVSVCAKTVIELLPRIECDSACVCVWEISFTLFVTQLFSLIMKVLWLCYKIL